MNRFHLILFLGAICLAEPGHAEDSVRLQFTEKDLPARDDASDAPSEIEQAARWLGFNYVAETKRAARGDAKAMRRFFQLTEAADGAAAESIHGMSLVVYHLLGDEKFAQFLAAQPVPFRVMVRNRILSDGGAEHGSSYLSRHFPRTAALLFQREMVGWISPNEQFAIRKVFSTELELAGSKVQRAELVERKTGRVLCDLTPDDIGSGALREGEALWSPDSKRVASLSSDLTVEAPPLRKQTSVYQQAGDRFVRVDISLGNPPDTMAAKEMESTIPGHEYTEPIRWQKPNVLILRRHEYYRKVVPEKVGEHTFNTIHDVGRQYQITATIKSDATARVVWKLQE